jgi:hypothetical protein
MRWYSKIEHGEKPMGKKPNRQIKVQFYRSAKMGFSKGTHTYTADGNYVWGVKIDIADHTKGYTFLDQNGFSIKFESLEKAKEYADGVVKEVIDFLDIE